MNESQSASPILTELHRLIAAQDALILLPTPMLDMSVSSIGTDPIAMVEMQDQITSVIVAASDADLVQAYQQASGKPNALNVDFLSHEIEQRNFET